MSYDLHGTWDMKNKWVGPYLNAHTNLTEIDQALDLLWRNDIDPAKVTLGLGFYGRSFTASSPACLTPGCTYASGAPGQPCSREVGVAINSEIDDIIARTGATPVLYSDAAVKVLTWDTNNWVAYDDADTFLMKTNYAARKCLGGVMVWAISHDTWDAKYSRALQEVAPLLPGSRAQAQTNQGPAYDEHQQCKWTNCGQGKLPSLLSATAYFPLPGGS
jgi:chitinase